MATKLETAISFELRRLRTPSTICDRVRHEMPEFLTTERLSPFCSSGCGCQTTKSVGQGERKCSSPPFITIFVEIGHLLSCFGVGSSSKICKLLVRLNNPRVSGRRGEK